MNGKHEKLELNLKQVYQFSLKEGKVRSSLERWQTLNANSDLLSGPTYLVQQLMPLKGLLTAIEKQVYLGHLHMRPTQWHLRTAGRYQNHWKGDSRSQFIPPPSKIVAVR